MAPSNAAFVETHTPAPLATMLRVTGDFHSLRSAPWVVGLPEHMFVVGNLSASASVARNATGGHSLFGVNGSYPDLDMMDLGRLSDFFDTPAADLHAAMWMMARSPLMYAGELPITDAHTLDLVTNPLALRINEASADLRVRYSGNCTCKVHNIAGNACKTPVANDCGAVWWATLGDQTKQQCLAVAVLNVGDHAKDTEVAFADIVASDDGGGPTAAEAGHTVTNVYGNSSTVVRGPSFTVTTQGMGAQLLIVTPEGVAADDC